MISNMIINNLMKKDSNIKSEHNRMKIGYISGVTGIIVNILLFVVKLLVGLTAQSVSIMADSFNNLSDAASSIITIVGFKLSSIPADKEHPFGHGRMEYISALVVAFMVMIVGFQFIKTSIDKILNPTIVKFSMIPFVLLVISILFKVFLAIFNTRLGKAIDSSSLKAAAFDSIGDVVTTTVVVISFLASKYTTLPIDGYIGVVVALVILISSINLIRETISPLLGEAPDRELVNNIQKSLMSYDNIVGVHDLIVHSYGPGRCMASIHAEIPSSLNVMDIHEIIDTAEREISSKLNIILVIHMDPICLDDDIINSTRTEVLKIVTEDPHFISMHDFRIVGDGKHKNILFDVVLKNDKEFNKLSDDELKQNLEDKIKKIYPSYGYVITIDRNYI